MRLAKYFKLNIRKEVLPYIITWMIYYAWVIVFTTWWTSSPTTDKLMGTDSRVLLHSLNLIASAVFVCIIKKEWFKKTSYIGGASVLLFSLLSLLKLNSFLHTISIILLSISLGIVNISILIPMVYIMNNNEKALSIIGTNILISLLVLLQELKILTLESGLIFSLIILILSLLPIIFFKDKDLLKEDNTITTFKSKFNKTMYLSIILNSVYAVFCKGMGKAFLIISIEKTTLNLHPTYYVGGIIGCFIFYIIYRINKANNYASWNIIFGLFATAMFIYATGTNTNLNYLFALITGMVSSMGMINMYYSLGTIGKKYGNHRYLKASILFIGLLGGISGSIFGRISSHANMIKTSMSISLIIVIIIVIFLVASPMLSNSYESENHTERNKKIIMNNFTKYKLTKKEEELCDKLIEGYTLKQASAMMGIKYNTANGYYKNIYKKLGVNSKIELLNKIKHNT